MMSGDHCVRERKSSSDGAGERQSSSTPPSESRSRGSGPAKNKSKNESGPQKGIKLSRNELLDAAEFNKTLATWFGEKGFIAMRSFFRASVLNSLQKDPIGLNQANCTDLDAAIVTLIADYLVKNGKYFTMSVFSNEVLRPLANSYPELSRVLQRIKQCEELDEPTLTRDMVSFVMGTIGVRSHSMLGAGILQKYLEARSGDLLSVLMGLLRDNVPVLNDREQAVRDDDVVAAFSEGLQEEMGKLHCWFSNFNTQFVDMSGKLRKMMCSQTLDNGLGPRNVHFGQDEQELWDQMVRMDEHLRKQQDCLMKMRDKERKKLASYAKELEDLHREMNTKLKSIQDYEKTLKIREKALRQNEGICVGSVDRRRGDYKSLDVQKRERVKAVRDVVEEQYNAKVLPETGQISSEMIGQIMQENLELKAALREHNLRIEALTKKAALLSTENITEPTTPPVSSVHYLEPALYMVHNRSQPMTSPAYHREVLSSKPPPPVLFHKPFAPDGSLASAMSSALRRARMEIDSLRNEQDTTDLQYDRLLHNKLSKR